MVRGAFPDARFTLDVVFASGDLVGGRLAEVWHQESVLGLLQQLGAIPAPPGPPASH